MIEQDTVAGEETVGFVVFNGLPVCIDFGISIGACGDRREYLLFWDGSNVFYKMTTMQSQAESLFPSSKKPGSSRLSELT
mgnify:CR=1 FL=1